MQMFRISKDQTKAIKNYCHPCQSPMSTGAVNPQGLQSLQLWQTDISKYSYLKTFTCQ